MASESEVTPNKTIAYVSGTRADFGLMTSVLRAIAASPRLTLDLYATGMHLMPEFGSTIEHVRAQFPDVRSLDAKIDSDDRSGLAAFVASLTHKLAAVFAERRPDFVLVLGDRAEMLATAMVCLYAGIPVAHVHGGERSGIVDDSARHAITRLAHLHLAATEDAAERIRNMGEEPWRIHVVGAPALDVILNEPLPSREALCGKLDLDPAKPFLLVTQHPVSGQWQDAGRHMRETLDAAMTFAMPTVIVYPNADAGGREMIREIERERANPLARIVESLPYRDFLALEREAAVWIGNSSAGIIESPSFKTPVINVGERQSDRLRAPNIIDAGYDRDEIREKIAYALNDPEFRARLLEVVNPWGDGKTGPRIAEILEAIERTSELLEKRITY